jgi:hypothetical protein
MCMVRVLMTLGAKDVANKQGKTPSNLADEAGHMECAAIIAMYRNNTSTSDAPPRRGIVSQHPARPVVLQVQHSVCVCVLCVCVCVCVQERERQTERERERERDCV